MTQVRSTPPSEAERAPQDLRHAAELEPLDELVAAEDRRREAFLGAHVVPPAMGADCAA